MAGFSLSFDIDAAALQVTLANIMEATAATKLVDAAAAIILNRTRLRYLEEKDPEGRPWEPSAAGMLRRLDGDPGTLFDTGTLWRSIQLTPAAEGNDDEAERRIIAGAINAQGQEYGQKHQFGLDGMPVRQFLGVPEEDVELFEGRIMQQIAETLGL